MPRTLAIIIERIGPYHAARLEALVDALGRDRLRVIEVASASTRYGWRDVSTDGFSATRLFEGVDYAAIPAGALSSCMVAALERLRPDVVAVNGWGFAEARAALGWCRRTRTPAVLMSDSQERDARRIWPVEVAKRLLVRRFSSALVAGVRHAEYVRKLGVDEARIVQGYDVVDNDHFARGAEAARRGADDARRARGLPARYWLASGRLVQEKNQRLLVEAFARYRQAAGADGWDLVLIGEGPLDEELRAAARALRIDAHVHMPGFVQYEELPAYYGLASGFVHPSAVEPWGLVVNEAMAAGLPVLVSDACGCVPELVHRGENGFTFEPRDREGLARLLGEVAAAPNRAAMGKRSQAIVAAFTPSSFARALQRAMELALGAPAAAGPACGEAT